MIKSFVVCSLMCVVFFGSIAYMIFSTTLLQDTPSISTYYHTPPKKRDLIPLETSLPFFIRSNPLKPIIDFMDQITQIQPLSIRPVRTSRKEDVVDLP